MNGGQDGYSSPAGGRWPGEEPSQGGGSPYGPPQGDPYGSQGAFGGTQPGGFGTQPGGLGGTQPGAFGGHTAQTPWQYGGEPPKKSRTGLIAGLVALGAVVVLGGGAVVFGLSSSSSHDAGKPASAASAAPTPSDTQPADVGHDAPHSLTVPKSVGDYQRLTGNVADRLASSMRRSMAAAGSGKAAAVYSKARIAIYSKNGDPARPLVFVGLTGDDSPEISSGLKSGSPSQVLDALFLGMNVGNTKDYAAGPLGGLLRCGTGSLSGSDAAACAWADSSTVGMLLSPRSDNARALSGTMLDLRNAAEH